MKEWDIARHIMEWTYHLWAARADRNSHRVSRCQIDYVKGLCLSWMESFPKYSFTNLIFWGVLPKSYLPHLVYWLGIKVPVLWRRCEIVKDDMFDLSGDCTRIAPSLETGDTATLDSRREGWWLELQAGMLLMFNFRHKWCADIGCILMFIHNSIDKKLWLERMWFLYLCLMIISITASS